EGIEEAAGRRIIGAATLADHHHLIQPAADERAPNHENDFFWAFYDVLPRRMAAHAELTVAHQLEALGGSVAAAHQRLLWRDPCKRAGGIVNVGGQEGPAIRLERGGDHVDSSKVGVHWALFDRGLARHFDSIARAVGPIVAPALRA